MRVRQDTSRDQEAELQVGPAQLWRVLNTSHPRDTKEASVQRAPAELTLVPRPPPWIQDQVRVHTVPGCGIPQGQEHHEQLSWVATV